MKTVLVVEDDRSMRDAIALILKYEGYNVLTAANGILALSIVKESMPNLVLLDMIMPEMNGWEFAENLRAEFKNPAPIIVITGAADASQRAKDINAVDHLEKPYEIDDLIAKVAKHSF